MLKATLFLQKFPETRNRNRYLFSGKISETRAQGKLRTGVIRTDGGKTSVKSHGETAYTKAGG